MLPEKNIVAKIRIDDCFKITGRGLVITGVKLEGHFNINDILEFTAFNKHRCRRIKGIEMIRFATPNPGRLGFLIETESEAEINELRGWKPEGDEGLALIFSKGA